VWVFENDEGAEPAVLMGKIVKPVKGKTSFHISFPPENETYKVEQYV
jgi:hypothetical protein